MPFLDNLRVSILQEKYTSKHVYPSIRVSPNSFHNLERISRGLAEPVNIFQPSWNSLVNWLYDNQETDEYQETEIEKCQNVYSSQMCILFDELWINLADITYSHLYLCRNWKIEGIFQRKNSSNKFLENYKNLQQFIVSLC